MSTPPRVKVHIAPGVFLFQNLPDVSVDGTEIRLNPSVAVSYNVAPNRTLTNKMISFSVPQDGPEFFVDVPWYGKGCAWAGTITLDPAWLIPRKNPPADSNNSQPIPKVKIVERNSRFLEFHNLSVIPVFLDCGNEKLLLKPNYNYCIARSEINSSRVIMSVPEDGSMFRQTVVIGSNFSSMVVELLPTKKQGPTDTPSMTIATKDKNVVVSFRNNSPSDLSINREGTLWRTVAPGCETYIHKEEALKKRFEFKSVVKNINYGTSLVFDEEHLKQPNNIYLQAGYTKSYRPTKQSWERLKAEVRKTSSLMTSRDVVKLMEQIQTQHKS